MAPDIVVRKCEKLEEFHRCVEIEREIWAESDLETEPYVTFVVAAQTGGQVLGAFEATPWSASRWALPRFATTRRTSTHT